MNTEVFVSWSSQKTNCQLLGGLLYLKKQYAEKVWMGCLLMKLDGGLKSASCHLPYEWASFCRFSSHYVFRCVSDCSKIMCKNCTDVALMFFF